MQEASGHSTSGWSVRLAYRVGVSLVCIGVCASYTFAQSPPNDPGAQAELKQTPAPDSGAGKKDSETGEPRYRPKEEVKSKALAKGKPSTRAGQARPASVGRRPITKSRMKMNPDAKWSCAQQTVALDPVWRGQQQLAFAFDISNVGTANLTIKAMGG